MKFLIALVVVALSGPALAVSPFMETRYCGEPRRDANGKIIRRADVLNAFARLYPCPSTGKRERSCSGWAIDHIIPLAVGGCDAVRNLQWLPNEIKSCGGTKCKDRWERDIYRRRS